jgi:hypothetical protein
MMRKFLAISFTLLYFINAQLTVYAQSLESDYVYFNSGVSTGNYIGGSLSLNYIHKEKYSGEIKISGLIRKPKSQPPDFSGGLFGSFSFGLSLPYDHIRSYEILFGKVKKLNEEGTIRWNLKGGFAYSKIVQPFNWKKVNNNVITNNYTFEYGQRNVISFVINPNIEFPFTRFIGFSISPFAVMNKEANAVGIEFKAMSGLIRRKINHSNG